MPVVRIFVLADPDLGKYKTQERKKTTAAYIGVEVSRHMGSRTARDHECLVKLHDKLGQIEKMLAYVWSFVGGENMAST